MITKAMWFNMPKTSALPKRKGKTSGKAWRPSRKSLGLKPGVGKGKKAK